VCGVHPHMRRCCEVVVHLSFFFKENFERGPCILVNFIFKKTKTFKKVYVVSEPSYFMVSYIVLVALSSILYLENNIRFV
jgi:hypothetical protein